MPKARRLPEEWIAGTLHTLNLAEHLGIRRNGVPSDLRIKRSPKSPNLIAQYLPAVDDDPRPGAGATRSGSGKRKVYEASMGAPDPWEAASKAVEWVKRHQKETRTKKDVQQQSKDYSLHAYWDRWFARISKSKKNAQMNYKKWENEQQNLWLAQGYGLKHQDFSMKSVEEVNSADFNNYFTVIDQRKETSKRAGDMGGTKKQLKTLINHLFDEARSADFHNLHTPKFPKISHQKKQSDHFYKEEWEMVMKKTIELTEGAGQAMLTPSEYANLDFKKADRQNQRYWVDFYDSLCLMYFFFLRPRDLKHLKMEWFQERTDEEGKKYVECTLQVTKGNRDIQRTENIRPDGYKVWKRIKSRKPEGYVCFPEINRESVLPNCRHLLNKVKEQCGITREGLTTTQIRHTAFRLICEEDFDHYSNPIHLVHLAYSGNTSTDMLRKTYLDPIRQSRSAAKSRSRLPEQSWSLVKRVDTSF